MTGKENINTGKWSLADIESLLTNASAISDAGERVSFLSGQFLGLPYISNSLVGDSDTEEVFTVDFSGVDCFTLIDYVEAMRLSTSFASFIANLKKVRYWNGIVSFERRNHFFTDWILRNSDFVEDVTLNIAAGRARTVRKQLNIKEDGMPYVRGIKPTRRDINYIPASVIDDFIVGRLKTGDYIGIYSGFKGLDVSHIGIFIGEGSLSVLRHASSRAEHRRVVDEDFIGYVSTKPGIIVLRPR